MKKLIAFCAALTVAAALCSCSGADNSQETDEITAVETVTDGTVYEYSSGGSDRIKSKVTYESGVQVARDDYEYYSDGSVKSVASYENGEWTQTWYYLYNDEGTLSRSTNEYDYEGISCKDVYDYNADGKTLKITYYEDDAYSGEYQYTYNEAGNVSFEAQYDVNGDELTHIDYTFNEAGSTNTASYYEYGSLSKSWSYVYNDLGQNTEILYYNSKGELTSKVTCTYDADGNVADSTYTEY